MRWTREEHWAWINALQKAVNIPVMGSEEHRFYSQWWHDLWGGWCKRNHYVDGWFTKNCRTFYDEEEVILEKLRPLLENVERWNKQFIEWDVWPRVLVWSALYALGWDYGRPLTRELIGRLKEVLKKGMETWI